MKRTISVFLASAFLLAGAASAHAGGRISARLSLAPTGSFGVDGGGIDISNDTEIGFGLGLLAEYDVVPMFSIGFAPQLMLNVKGEDAEDSAKMLDLMARGTFNVPVSVEGLTPYAFGALGYSMLFIPDFPDELDTPAGLAFGVGAGARYKVAPKFEVLGELSYQKSMPSVSEGGDTLDFDVSYFMLTAGAAFDL